MLLSLIPVEAPPLHESSAPDICRWEWSMARDNDALLAAWARKWGPDLLDRAEDAIAADNADYLGEA